MHLIDWNQQIEGDFMKRMQNTSFFVLLTIIMLMTGCASTYKDLMPQQPVSSPQSIPHFNGTVDVHSIIKPERMGFDIGYDLPIHAYVDNAMLETALKESVAKSEIFTRVEQKNAEYVLDVWVDGVESHQPSAGIGDYGARVFSIWRLTRARDGKVLVCDFVDGNGLINTMVSAPRTKSLGAALKDVIQNGLRVLADTSKEHLSAMHVAGIRRSMGPPVPEGLKAWEDKVKQNWSKLRKGLSLEEVETIIGPVKTSGALERIYLKFKTWFFTYDSITYHDENTGARVTVSAVKSRYVFLDKESLTHYDEDMGSALELMLGPERIRDKVFPHYDEHSYVCDKNPPNTVSISGKDSVYYMTHLYVLKLYREGLQTWILR
jgi:hypothetical protein